MKKFIGVLLFVPFTAFCQVTINYSYDNSGNRVSKTISTLKMEEVWLSADSLGNIKNDDPSLHTTLSPNPANEKIEIFSDELSLPFNYTLLDLNGKILVHGQSSENSMILQLNEYNTGTYILVLSDKFKKLKYKIIKF